MFTGQEEATRDLEEELEDQTFPGLLAKAGGAHRETKGRGGGVGICARELTADCPLQALPAVLAVTLKEVGEQALQSQTTPVFGRASAGFLDKPWGPEPVPQEGLLLAVTCLAREEPSEVPGLVVWAGLTAAVIVGQQSPGWALYGDIYSQPVWGTIQVVFSLLCPFNKREEETSN